MNVAMHTRVQIAVAIISFATVMCTAPAAGADEDTQSFIGTAPVAEMAEAQPATF